MGSHIIKQNPYSTTAPDVKQFLRNWHNCIRFISIRINLARNSITQILSTFIAKCICIMEFYIAAGFNVKNGRKLIDWISIDTLKIMKINFRKFLQIVTIKDMTRSSPYNLVAGYGKKYYLHQMSCMANYIHNIQQQMQIPSQNNFLSNITCR